MREVKKRIGFYLYSDTLTRGEGRVTDLRFRQLSEIMFHLDSVDTNAEVLLCGRARRRWRLRGEAPTSFMQHLSAV